MSTPQNGKVTLFDNKILEFLTRSHPLVIWGFYLPLLGSLIYLASCEYKIWQILLVFFCAMVSWTLFEYIAHRFVFHWVSNNVKSKRFTYIIHGNHHEYPRDKQRLFMPLLPSILISGTLFSIQYMVLGSWVLAFFPGFMFGYLIYASTHYAIHAWEAPFPFLRPLWRNHLMHHYQNEQLGFGVSNIFWDWVFRTGFDNTQHEENREKEKALKF